MHDSQNKSTVFALVPRSSRKVFVQLLLVTAVVQSVTYGTKKASGADDWASELNASPASAEWTEIPAIDKVKTLKFLADQTKSNYQRVRTWSGSYTETSQGLIAAKRVREISQQKLSDTSVVTRFQATHSFAVDVAKDSLLTQIQNGADKYAAVDSRELPKLPFFRDRSEALIATPEHELHFAPQNQYQGFAVLGQMQLPPKRAAFRDPPQYFQLSLFGNELDPRMLFGVNPARKPWEEYAELSRKLRGDYGAAVKNTENQQIRVYKAKDQGEIWYRVLFLEGGKDEILKEYVHRSDCGFNLVRLAEWDPPGPRTNIPRLWFSWDYKLLDGIYVPSVVTIRHGHLREKRLFELQDCSLNDPIPPERFTYGALGLQDGDLVMDRIEKVAYVYKSSGLEKLADFDAVPTNDLSQPRTQPRFDDGTEESGRLRSRIILLVANLVALFLVLVTLVILRIRRRKKSTLSD